MELYPGVKISIGPPIDNGFYYDFEFPEGVTVSDADFERIEQKMREHVNADERFVREDVTGRRGARALPRPRARTTRSSSSRTSSETKASRPSASTRTARSPTSAAARTAPARSASRRSSCSPSPARTGAATPTARSSPASTAPRSSPRTSSRSTSSASSRPRRATTAAWARSSACSRSPRSRPAARSGCPPGTTMFNELVALSREMGIERGYTEVKTPQLYDSELWKISGHWGKYREHMFVTETEDREFGVKPMNCPGHAHLFSMQKWSYRDLPVRYSEPGLLHRNEPSGTLHGLLRVRHFAQDDAHIFCTEEQVQDEVGGLPGLRLRHLRAVRHRAAPRAVDAPGAAGRRRRAVGPRGGRARAGARRRAGCRTCSTRATAPSTGRRSTCT